MGDLLHASHRRRREDWLRQDLHSAVGFAVVGRSAMDLLRSIPRNRSANKNLADAIAAASLIGDLKIADLDEVTEEVVAAADHSQHVSMDNLRLERPIGLGGQGGVWLAVDYASGVRSAVKQVRKGRLAALPRKSAMRVFTEKDALNECRHPFITRLFGTFQDNTSLYFCMELMGAGDLFGLLDLYPTGLPELHARFYTAIIALALRHIHAHGYVYRDVKLENVLIGEDGYVKARCPSRPASTCARFLLLLLQTCDPSPSQLAHP